MQTFFERLKLIGYVERLVAYAIVCAFSLSIILGENLERQSQKYIRERVTSKEKISIGVAKPVLALKDLSFSESGPGSLWWNAEWFPADDLVALNNSLQAVNKFSRRNMSLVQLGRTEEGLAETFDRVSDEVRTQIALKQASIERVNLAYSRQPAYSELAIRDKAEWHRLESIPLFDNDSLEEPVRVAKKEQTKVSETISQVAASPERSSAAVDSVLPSEKKSILPPAVKIVGALSDEAKAYPGHFEVGFYRALGAAGTPVGAPAPQQLLRSGQTQFELTVPRKAKGYLFARFVSADGSKKYREWYGFPQFIDLNEVSEPVVAMAIPIDKRVDAPVPVPLSTGQSSESLEISGSIAVMFQQDKNAAALGDVRIRLRGSKLETSTLADGTFRLVMPQIFGRASFEVLKGGYQPRVIDAELPKSVRQINLGTIEIPSQKSIQNIAQSLGVRINSNTSVLMLEAKTKDGQRGLPGISVRYKGKADGPFYFSDQGVPQAGLKATSSDGRIILFNIDAGVEFLETFVLGEAYAPLVISTLGAGELIHRRLNFSEVENKVAGRILDPVSSQLGVPAPVSGMRVKLLGTNQFTETDALGGFEFSNQRLFPDAEFIVEVTGPNYYRHRFTIRKTKNTNFSDLELYVFPQNYINRMAKTVDVKLDPAHGLILGSVGAQERLRLDTLLDHSTENAARDFYFDAHNVIQGSHAYTEPGFGTYVVFGVGRGRALLHGYNPKGELRYSDFVYSSPSTISILVSP